MATLLSFFSEEQLAQVDQALAAAGGAEDLRQLKCDLEELVSLTEGSLLSLKKSLLLKSLEDVENVMTASSTSPAEPAGDEYKAFQAKIQDQKETDSTERATACVPSSGVNSTLTYLASKSSDNSFHQSLTGNTSVLAEDDSSSEDSFDEPAGNKEGDLSKGNNLLSSVDEDLSDLVGLKCRAPHSHDWGKLDYHNALIISARKHSEQEEHILVNVMFTTPTHSSMLPCKFYLDGHCRFSSDQCRYSHGYEVRLEELREFIEADHSTLAIDMKCLAQYSDKIWYAATITDIKDDLISVHFDDYGEDLDVDIAQVVPSESPAGGEGDTEDESDQDLNQGRQTLDASDSEDGEELPVFLWRPPQSTAAFGEWEAHTRGIGSKLMARMGYVVGEGLGTRSQGKAEPVPIMLLPQGKSLDRIMELKEMAGSSDLFDAMKRLEKQKKKADKKREDDATRDKLRSSNKPPNVFDFINRRLHGKRGDLSSLGTGGEPERDSSRGHNSTSGRRHISEHELHKKSDRDINVQVLKTHEEIRHVERSLSRLREALARNENRDRGMAAQLRSRLAEQEAYLSTLQSSSSALEKHQQKRSDYKKLAIF
ncbi:zinc finger CCCH-type with G patch domain-containing protein-like isoform X2 [Pomacea canaliculata]|uniref:zinc finger CCCH-type with G patch domain-containing protein-like isoform X2 n=1 Tax=Pomacea canaliculata TaxID=400727 RepID=UPI000D72E0BC|nr:zinc finger CCCH-type with G patch domain-containing protein-like isoform X2 [Pomacea canaliculata]